MKVAITIPAHNEEAVIEKNIRQVQSAFSVLLSDYDWQVIIAENTSTDNTASIIRNLLYEFPRLRLIQTQAGKGAAIMKAWEEFEADLYVFMDADLATDINAIKPLLLELTNHDVAIGSRHIRGSVVSRSVKRKLCSHIYNQIARTLLPIDVYDLQCGFKGVRHNVVKNILPSVKHRGFFFDTELLVLCKQEGYIIKELPIIWKEDDHSERSSRVNIWKTTKELLLCLHELRNRIKRN
jgi:glycosyltransferase involved in cell wall biosynthesis